MQLERHGWDIHAVSAERIGAAGGPRSRARGFGDHGSVLEPQEHQKHQKRGRPHHDQPKPSGIASLQRLARYLDGRFQE